MKAGFSGCRAMAVTAALAVIVFSTCSKNSSSGDDADDGNSPYNIVDLTVDTVTASSIKLIWTATGDDADQGTASSYDIRYWKVCLTTGNWDSATQVSGEPHPSPAGQMDSVTIIGLTEDSTYYFAMKICDEASNCGNSGCVSGMCFADVVVTFADANLEAFVRALISKSSGDILRSELMPHTLLGANNQGIASLSGIEYWSSLRGIGLGGNHVTDLTPLSGLTNIVGLGLTDNGLSDISPLAGLVNMEILQLRTNSVVNLSAISGLVKLHQLDLTQNDITDLSPLVANTGFATGDTVWVGENPLSQTAIDVQIPALTARGAAVMGL